MTTFALAAAYPKNMAAHGPPRSLIDLLAELQARYSALPMTDPARGELALRIVAVEAAIDEAAGP